MEKTVLHITNGSSLTAYLKELDFEGTFLSWQEMLCEGPTIAHIDSEEFFNIRRDFLKTYYDVEINEQELQEELEKLNDTSQYSEIILWFEYDLFCHINMLGVLNLLHQKEVDLPLFLVCSGRVEGEKDLKGLPELSPEQLMRHYDDRIELKDQDKELAVALWRTYCGKDHNLFKPYIIESSSFKYMGSCLSAHLKRFPDSRTGLNILEHNILRIVRDNEIKSKHHLLGYSLNYQGYYGFGDLQMERIIDNLSMFFDYHEGIKLNRKGHEALMGHHNFTSEINNDMTYGGINRMAFQFSKTENKLINTILNAY